MPVNFLLGENNFGDNTVIGGASSLKTTSVQIRPAVKASIIKTDRKHADDTNPTVAAFGLNPKPRPKPVVSVRARGPRFGLVQWQRLVRSSEDLAQRKGAALREAIPWEEIKQHNHPHDCWMVLRGVVYNIGPYLAYHPGGQEIFSRAKLLGADGTKLYDKYHRWVNIEGLIGSLAIGTVASATENGEEQDAPASKS